MLAPSSPNPAPFRQSSVATSQNATGNVAPIRAPEGRDLFGLRQLEATFDEASGTLWSFMRPDGRPSYTPPMLRDFDAWQDGIEARFRDRPSDLRYLVLGSRFAKVFCLGGDLDHFVDRIRQRDRSSLVRYGRACTN